MTYGFTGHRPPRLGGYGKEARQKLYNFAHKVVRIYLDPEYGYSIGQNNTAIVGMAQGWDMAVASACVTLDVPYTAAVPFPGQELVWPDPEIRALYKSLVESAAHVVYVSSSIAAAENVSAALQFRNQYIVDHSDKVIALWDGIKGGTGNCVSYARKRKVEVINVWSDWEAFQQ
jgi:uncharacterized phage-like protein YoqJ